MKDKNEIPQKPTGTLKERLERLNKEFKPKSVSVALAFNKDFKLSDVLEDYVSMLEKLEAYIKNGHSCNGLWFTFVKVKEF